MHEQEKNNERMLVRPWISYVSLTGEKELDGQINK